MANSYKEWSILEWLGVITAIFAVIGGVYGFFVFVDNTTKDRTILIPVHDEYVHLGDNNLANIGGEISPKTPVPGGEDLQGILIFDKSTMSFGSFNGFPSEILSITDYYEGEYINANLSAYKHVKILNSTVSAPTEYVGQSVNIGGSSVLAWIENEGNFYHEKAPVALTKTINVFKYLTDNSIDPKSVVVKEAYLQYYGSHSGRRAQQSESVDVIVNGVVHSIKFNSISTRPEEFVRLKLSESIFNEIKPTSTRFTVVVLPFQEKYPIPPAGGEFDSRGPAHFRDIEIWELKLELVLD